MRAALFVALTAGVLLQRFAFCDIHSAVVRPYKFVEEMAEVGARYTPTAYGQCSVCDELIEEGSEWASCSVHYTHFYCWNEPGCPRCSAPSGDSQDYCAGGLYAGASGGGELQRPLSTISECVVCYDIIDTTVDDGSWQNTCGVHFTHSSCWTGRGCPSGHCESDAGLGLNGQSFTSGYCESDGGLGLSDVDYEDESVGLGGSSCTQCCEPVTSAGSMCVLCCTPASSSSSSTSTARRVRSKVEGEVFSEYQPTDDNVVNAILRDAFDTAALLTPQSCNDAVNYICHCEKPCSLRCGLTGSKVFDLRADIHEFPLANGARRSHVASILRTSHEAVASHHPARSTLGPRNATDRKKQQHCVINNVDVCIAEWQLVAGVSNSLFERAAADANSDNSTRAAPVTPAALKEQSVQRMYISEWFLKHVVDSGAEKIPLGDADGVETALAFHAAQNDGMEDSICQLRLNENELSDLYGSYKQDAERRFDALGIRAFREVFESDPRLAHIYMSRRRDTFSVCNKCCAAKLILSNKRTPAPERAAATLSWKEHLQLMNRERLCYVANGSKTEIDKSDPQHPRILNCLSMAIDKMTKQSTLVPFVLPMPKCLDPSKRLGVITTFVVVHGIGTFVVTSYNSQTEGPNLTLEALEQVLHYLTTVLNYTLPAELAIQFDNHHDNKTPVVILWAGYLVYRRVFARVKLTLLPPGHSHIDVDQKISVTARKVKKPSSFAFSRSRLFDAFTQAWLIRENRPILIDLLYVRDFSNAFVQPREAALLARLTCSGDSGDAQYAYTIERCVSTGEVVLTYKAYASDVAVFPSPFNVGQRLELPAGTGQVTSMEYVGQVWKATVAFDNGTDPETISGLVAGIRLFSDPQRLPLVPVPEVMRVEWPGQLNGIKRNIASCTEKLPVFDLLDGLSAEWASYFAREEAAVAASRQDPLGPYYRAGAVIPQLPPAVLIAALPPLPPPLPRLVWDVNPLTHAGFSDADRKRIHAQQRDPPELRPGSLVLLKLKLSSVVVASHTLPFCLARIPAGPLPPSGALSFGSLFTTATSGLDGKWTEGGIIVAPLGAIMVSGVELTRAFKLTAPSKSKITLVVAPYDLEI